MCKSNPIHRGVWVCRAAILVALASPWRTDAAQISTAGGTFKVRADQTALSFTSVSISAARNEFEGFQILVTGPATGVAATATSLSNGSSTIAAPRLFREALLNVSTPSAPDGWAVATSDALIPDFDEFDNQKRLAFTQSGFSWDVPSGQTQAIWGEVFVPPSTPPGTYTGSVAVTFQGGSQNVPITLTVYGFDLPSTSSLKSVFQMSFGGSAPGSYGNGFTCCGVDQETLRARFDRLALEHRISLSSHDDGSGNSIATFNQFYGPYVAGTAPTQLSGAHLTNVNAMQGLTDTAGMSAWFNNFSSHGWPNILFQYTCDEPPQTCAWSDISVRAQAAKNANANYRTLVTTDISDATNNGVASSIDVLVPVINFMDDKPGFSQFAGNQRPNYNSFLASGPLKEVWIYQSCMSHGCGGTSSYFTGWPSYMVDATASRNRAMQWLAYKYHTTGELYYEVVGFTGDPWSSLYSAKFGGNGDGVLFYPGYPAKIGGTSRIPIASYRLKMIREGYEDYEYLKLLADSGDPTMAQTEVDNLFPHAYQTDVNPQLIMDARNRIAQRILALKGGVTLTVAKTGTSGGVTVTSSPAGLNCGASCSGTYSSGASVTLTATPAAGTTFDGFSGACTSSTTTCTFTISANATVNVAFHGSTPSCATGDCFNRANAGSLGPNWITVAGAQAISGNQVVASNAGNQAAQFVEAIGPDQDISVDCKVQAAGNNCAVIGRYADSSHFYYAYLDVGQGGVALFRQQGAAATQLGFVPRTMSLGTYYRIRLVLQGGSLSTYFNNEASPAISVTDTAVTGNYGGLHAFSSAANMVLWDNFNSIPAGATVLFADNFTRTTGLGSSWTQNLASAFSTDGTFSVSGPATPSGSGNWAWVLDLGTDNYAVQADLIVPAGSTFSGVVARSDTVTNTLYAAQLASSGLLNLYKRVGGTWTLLETVAAGLQANTTYTVKLVTTGANPNPVHLEVWLDGFLRLTHDDAGGIQSGRAGIQNYDPNVKYTNFTVYAH